MSSTLPSSFNYVSNNNIRKLREAAERRKIQNRNAQRRYRESLKRKLESLEVQNTPPTSPLELSEINLLLDSKDFQCPSVEIGGDEEDSRFSSYIIPSSYGCEHNFTCEELFAPEEQGTVELNIVEYSLLSESLSRSSSLSSETPIPVPSPLFPSTPKSYETRLPTTQDNTDTKSTLLHLAAAKNHGSVITILLDHNISPTKPNSNGETALHIAAENGHTDSMIALLDKTRAVDIDIRNSRGETALVLAVKAGKEEAVKLLIERGADLSVGVLGADEDRQSSGK